MPVELNFRKFPANRLCCTLGHTLTWHISKIQCEINGSSLFESKLIADDRATPRKHKIITQNIT